MEQRTRRRLWWSIAGAGVVLIGVAGGVYLWLKSDSARPVSVDDVVNDFRAATGGSTSTTSTMPATTTTTGAATSSGDATTAGAATSTTSTTAAATTTTTSPTLAPGVYLYVTTGDERVDALGGSDHAYPQTTTLTVTSSGDGCLTTRWTALDQRWDETQVCPDDGGWLITARTTFHSFFHQDDERAFTCTADSFLLPADLAPGTTFRASCNSPGTGQSGASSEDYSASIVGFETLDVGGQQVETVRVHYDVTVGGESTGGDSIERWYDRQQPMLLVREERTAQTTSPTAIGDVHYEEQYTLMLQDLQPIS
jgi:hypothetical protein